MRVRLRALELQRQQERLWVICVCCVAVTLGTAFTTAVLWRGLAWMGQQAQLPGPVWQIGLVALGLMPAIVAGNPPPVSGGRFYPVNLDTSCLNNQDFISQSVTLKRP